MRELVDLMKKEQADLVQAWNRLDRAIKALQPRKKRRKYKKRATKEEKKHGRKKMSAKDRTRISKQMKAYWASRRAVENAKTA